MPLKNYSTKISAKKTVGEIMDILSNHNAREILTKFDVDGDVDNISFRVDTPHGKLPFTLPLNIDAVQRTLNRQWDQGQRISQSQTTREHARRVGWRTIKDWLDAQMALIETEQVEFEQIFLPYLQVNKDQNLYQSMLETDFQVALPAGSADDITR